nr:outer membrane lipoprotein LolB [Roseateles koreensis]
MVLAEGDVNLNGRLSVQVNNSGSARATGGNAGFELTGNPAAGQLTLSTPLGSLLARASWRPGEVKLQTPDADRSYTDLDELTRELLGEPIPVAALFDWLQGRPWPQVPSRPLLAPSPGFFQLGWRVDLSAYDAATRQGLIVATRSAADSEGSMQNDPTVTLRARIEP